MRKWIVFKYWSLKLRFQLFRYDVRVCLAKKLHQWADRIDPEHGVKEPLLVDNRHTWFVEGRSLWR